MTGVDLTDILLAKAMRGREYGWRAVPESRGRCKPAR